jgi:hypothetical protein
MRAKAYNFKKEDKTEIAIYISLVDNYSMSSYYWRIDDIEYKPFRKRKWQSYRHDITDCYKYRSMDYSDRETYLNKKYEEFVGKDAIIKAYIAAWESLKPDIERLVGDMEVVTDAE